MKKAIAMAWVVDLRNPAFKQGKWRLRNSNNEFCCLGLMCNLHAKNNPAIAATQFRPMEYLGGGQVLPTEVMTWAGMKSHEGTPAHVIKIGRRTYSSLTEANDAGVKFGDIANWIEKNYRKL